jgi:hypothetical protein
MFPVADAPDHTGVEAKKEALLEGSAGWEVYRSVRGASPPGRSRQQSTSGTPAEEKGV